MKRATKAAVLSFIVPGAGLLYVGKAFLAAVNLGLAIALTVGATLTAHEHVHYAFLAIAAGSAGYAHSVSAKRSEQDPRLQSTSEAAESNGRRAC